MVLEWLDANGNGAISYDEFNYWVESGEKETVIRTIANLLNVLQAQCSPNTPVCDA